MNCSICGGRLKRDNDLYVCENCGHKQHLASFFEEAEVFICYVENDEYGRRTKDSIIAQEIYNRLKDNNIKCFYQRAFESASERENNKNVNETAIQKSKVIIVLATSNHNFKKLLDSYTEYFCGKTIIPVYSGLNAADIPEALGALQAMDYDIIGAVDTLTKSILQLLGRENEINISRLVNSTFKKRRKIAILSITSLLAMAIAAAAYFTFCTPYVLKSKKYSYAEKLVSEGKYVEAIEIYSVVDDYKNSKNELQSIYNKYDGYYMNEEQTICLFLNIDRNHNSEIKLIKASEDGNISFDTNVQIDGSFVTFDFKDTNNTAGTGSIKLSDEGVQLNAKTTDTSDFSIGEINILFKFENKSDSPIVSSFSANDITGWLKNMITDGELKKKGYELTLKTINDDNLIYVCGKYNEDYDYYTVKDTTVDVMIFNRDISKEDIIGNLEPGNKIIFGVYAPAKLVIPDRIGQLTQPFIENDILFVPNKIFYELDRRIPYTGIFSSINIQNPSSIDESYASITDDTPVGIISKTVGKKNWENIIKYQFINPIVYNVAKQKYGDSFMKMDTEVTLYIENETDSDFLVSYYLKEKKLAVFYRIKKTDGTVTFVSECPYVQEDKTIVNENAEPRLHMIQDTQP
ncbi:MAG: TIR domain-containing protein [Clostridia bacterium]|nr:TIR domain-containing protein [Clostridia bacterium]